MMPLSRKSGSGFSSGAALGAGGLSAAAAGGAIAGVGSCASREGAGSETLLDETFASGAAVKAT